MDTGLLPIATARLSWSWNSPARHRSAAATLYELAGRLRGPDDQCARARSQRMPPCAETWCAGRNNVAFDVGWFSNLSPTRQSTSRKMTVLPGCRSMAAKIRAALSMVIFSACRRALDLNKVTLQAQPSRLRRPSGPSSGRSRACTSRKLHNPSSAVGLLLWPGKTKSRTCNATCRGQICFEIHSPNVCGDLDMPRPPVTSS